MSPPCVAFFDGDNGGATYQGVKGDEIRIIVYSDRLGDPQERSGVYYDLGKPAEGNEPHQAYELRLLQRYFNDRFQTYDRFVHFWLYYAPEPPDENPVITPEIRRADAADNFSRIRPFATVTSPALQGNEEAYIQDMAARGVLNFGSKNGMRLKSFYKQYPSLIWSYAPTVETSSRLFSTYACEKVVGQPVVDSGNEGVNGRARTLGLLTTTDSSRPDLIALGKQVRSQMEGCGAHFAVDRTFPRTGRVSQAQGNDKAASYAVTNIADMQRNGVTTIIQAGGFETDQSKAAGAIDYFPEWIIAGDGQVEGNSPSFYQDQDVWSHAWVVTNAPRIDEHHSYCRQAMEEADPAWGTANLACTLSTYEDLRQMFIGVQVAGPRLNPPAIERGFRAIPATPSTSPYITACFYPADDYTCVKDATREWYDRDAPELRGRTTYPVCYRMIEEGKRFLSGTWPEGNINSGTPKAKGSSAKDPCNRFDKNFFAF